MSITQRRLVFASSVLALCAAPSARAQTAEELFHEVRARWESEDEQGIAGHLGESVEIRLGRRSGRADREEAARWLREYFESVEVVRFAIPRDGMGATSCVYEQELADADGKRRRNRIYVTLSLDAERRLRITSLKE